MQKIAQQSGGNCVARALSTMRLTLGYRKAMPDGFVLPGSRNIHGICCMASEFFPCHRIIAWCAEEYTKHTRVVHMPPKKEADIDATLAVLKDDYILAFTYYTNAKQKAKHIVVGYPALYGHMKTNLILGVSLEPTTPLFAIRRLFT